MYLARKFALWDRPPAERAVNAIALIGPFLAAHALRASRLLSSGAEYWIHGSPEHLGISIRFGTGELVTAHRVKDAIFIHQGRLIADLPINDMRYFEMRFFESKAVAYHGRFSNGEAVQQYLLEIAERGTQHTLGRSTTAATDLFTPGRNDCAAFIARVIARGGGDDALGMLPTRGREVEFWLEKYGTYRAK